MDKLNKKNSGQSLVELIVAVSIGALILVALLAGVTMALRSAQLAKKKTQAIAKAQETIEWLRGEKEQSWTEFASHSDEYCLNSLNFNAPRACLGDETDDNGFACLVNLIFSDENGDGIDDKSTITVTVSWEDNHGKHHESLKTYLTKN